MDYVYVKLLNIEYPVYIGSVIIGSIFFVNNLKKKNLVIVVIKFYTRRI